MKQLETLKFRFASLFLKFMLLLNSSDIQNLLAKWTASESMGIHQRLGEKLFTMYISVKPLHYSARE
jgi:hypothetical protein